MLWSECPVALRMGASGLLCGLYAHYVYVTVRSSAQLVSSGHATSAPHALWATRCLKLPHTSYTIAGQLLFALALLVGGAKGFIMGIALLATLLHISPLVLALLVVPIATELPEKVNSAFWVYRRKDTLAFGNLTGAMVFQGSLLPAFGIIVTPWVLDPVLLPTLIVTGIGALWIYLYARMSIAAPSTHKGIPIVALLGSGLLYIGYVAMILSR
jgi:cation:H+ antiporter